MSRAWMTDDQATFLRELMKWTGAATSKELGPQFHERHNSVRQTCKKRGWVTYDGSYWRITEAGRDALKMSAS